jgi:hypothetical protein
MLYPSDYPETARWPALRDLLRLQVDMQVADLRTLLCLPRPDEPGLGAGCNLTAATLAFNIVAGASVLFWESSVEAIERRGDRGPRFRRLVEAKYPWTPGDAVGAELGSEVMWDWARSPLTHTLGVGKSAHLFPGQPRRERGVWFVKSRDGLPADAVDELLSSYEKLDWLPATITHDYGGYAIHVDALAWGVARMLRHLFADEEQASRANDTAGKLLHFPKS